jgi:hypothetical protein
LTTSRSALTHHGAGARSAAGTKSSGPTRTTTSIFAPSRPGDDFSSTRRSSSTGVYGRHWPGSLISTTTAAGSSRRSSGTRHRCTCAGSRPRCSLAPGRGNPLSRTTPGHVLLTIVGGSYALFLVAGAAILGSRVGVRLAPHVALALGIMHLLWGTGFLASAGMAALGRIPGFPRLRP